MADSATIVAASLDSSQLETSINKLVSMVAEKTKAMADNFTSEVGRMEQAVKNLGNIKIDSGGTADGGSSRRTSKQKEEEAQIKATTQAYKEQNATLDQQAAAIRKANQVSVRTGDAGSVRNADTLQMMQTSLDIQKESLKDLVQRLREARQQYSSFVAMAAQGARTGDTGLYKFATEGVRQFENEVKSLIPQIRNTQSTIAGMESSIKQMGDVIAPQGHTIQNYVNSLQKANPELAALNEQFKRGKSLLQQQETEFEKNAQAQRNLNSATNQQKKILDEMNASVRLNIQREQERKNAILQTGIAARETANQLIKSAHEQASAQSNTPITGAKELAAAVEQMRRAYFDLSSSEKISPIGRALEEDIKRANEALTIIRKYNQSLVGSQHEERYNITNASTLDSLRQSLKGLTDQYNKLTVAELNAGKGDALIQHFQDTTRAAQILQKTLNRPVSLKAALAGDERTLDDIAYKMQRLRAYKQGIDLTKPNSANEIKQVDEALVRLQKDMDKYLSKSRDVLNSNNALGRSWNYMKNRLAFYFTVGASTQFIKNLIEVRSQYEMNERALGILINSAERGTQIFNELSQMALVSPYTLIELSNAAKQLTAYDIAAKDVVETTRRLADMASAVGVPMERLTYALGQIKAYGYLNSRDARMFANAGIPLVRELSKYYSELEGKVVSVGDVYDRMKKKAIDFNSVMAVVTKMTDEGGKFFDFQAKMADTLKVRLANLALAWNNMLNDIGASQQGVLTSSIGILRDLFLHWQDIYGAIQRVVLAIGLWKGAQALALLAVGELNTKMGMQVLLGEKLQTRLSSLASSTKNLVSGYAVAGAALLFVIADAIMTYQRNAEEIEKLNKVIVDGAKESANSIYEFIESAEMSYARLSARTGKLPKPDAEKTWDALREQIELSAISAKDIIPELIKIEDLNERVTKAFNLAERIAEANNKLIDLDGKLDISQNSILFGLFGEGLVEDIDDFNERLKTSAQTEELYLKSTGSVITDIVQGLTGFFNDMKEELGSSTDEAEIEIKNFAHNAAEAIKDELGEEGLKDSIQVNEAVSRVLKGVEQQFPQIKGKGKALFESIYNDIMATEFEGAVDKQAYYYKLFLERLKKDHGSAFQGVTEDIDRETFRWSDAQMKAIQKTADRIKEDIPEAYQDSVTEILNDLNTREFKMRIVAEFATSSLDDINKAFRRRFIEAGTDAANAQIDATQKGLDRIKNLSPWGGGNAGGRTISQKETENLQKFGSLMRKQNESDLDYQERIRKERQKKLDIQATEAKIIAANTGKEEEGAKAVLASAQEQKKAADDWLDAASQVEKWGGYDFSTKKENTAATKAQHAAETELQKALKDELQLIDKVRSQYKKLTDAGANDGEALVMVTNQFANSLAHVNNVLGKNGIPLFDISKFAGTDNPKALLDMLKLQLDSAKIAKNIKPEEIKELEVKYSEIVVDARAYNLTKITKGLNNELDRLKEEYELAVSLDADPELGNMFADYMGINLDELPRNAEQAARKAQKYIDQILAENNSNENIDINELMNKKDFDDWVETSGHNLEDGLVKVISAIRAYLIKLRTDETKSQMQEWDKLLEKYAEYETKINKIQNDAVKERVTFAQQFGNQDQKNLAINLQTQILAATDPQVKQKLIEQLQELIMSIAGDDKTKLNIAVSINNKQVEELAKASFEQFQKSPEWILATGDLVGMTDKALGGLIDKLEEFKKSAKDLDSKQIKNLNNALKNLYKQRRQGNPFSALINAMSEAKNRALDLQPEIDKVSAEIERLESIKNKGNIAETADELEKLKNRLNELKKVQQEVSKLNTTEWVNSLKSSYDSIRTAIGLFDDLAKAISGAEESDLDKVFKVIDKAVSGAQTGSSFGTYGAIIGAVVGAASGIITEYKDVWNGQEKINDQLKESTEKVRILTTTYNKLQRAIDDAYGMEAIGYQKLTIMNKQAELAELERQLELEKSRSAKNRDLEKISELEDKVEEARYELKNATREMVQDLLGIGDAQDWADNFVSSMIDAFRKGEDYMEEYDTSFQKMVDNLIAKAIAGKLIGEKMEKWLSDIEQMQYKNADENPTVVAAKAEVERLQQGLDMLVGLSHDNVDVPSEELDRQKKALWEAQQKYEEAYKKASELSRTDVDSLRENVNNWRQGVKDDFEEYMELFGILYGSDKAKSELSALQQGIQGITEDTAGALEGYMNIVSQQVFLHSELLTQIRDVLVGGDGDIQLGVQAQMLLQLQQSYQVQMAIQGILEGWSTPSGMGVRVELIS